MYDRQVNAGTERDQLLSPREASRLIGLSLATIYRLRRAGAFPIAIAISPGRIAFRRGEILDWLAARPRVHMAAEQPSRSTGVP